MKKLILLSILLAVVITAVWFGAPRASQAAPGWQNFSPPLWTLGPIQGADGGEKAVLNNLDAIAQWKLPITAFHFDAPDWMQCTGNAQFRYSDAVLNRMRARNIRGLFWIVPLIGIQCPEYQVALANNYFVKDSQGQVIVTNNFVGQGSWIDFNNPNAVAYWHTLLDGLRARVGNTLAGFYTDSVRPDDPTGQTGYGEAYAADLLAYTRANVPDGDVVFKRYGTNTPSDAWLQQNAHIAYVNDLPTDYSGLQAGILRVFDTNLLMPLAFNEFSGYANTPPDAETYIRRMQWGAFQPVMENVPKGAQPWDPRFPPQVMQAYRYYATLHAELQPYLHSYDQAAFETKTPIFRDMNSRQYSARLGNEFFVKYVTSPTTAVRFRLPAGQWINYWNESQIFQGSTTILYPTPVGKEPILIARGAIIPMQVRSSITGHGTRFSDGALTLNVYSIDHSTFRYHDLTNGWLTFDVTTQKQRAALCTLDQIPSQPLLWRLNSVKKQPKSVTAQNGAVGVNTAWGAALPQRSSEIAVEKAASGWFYDAPAQRLIIKISTLGTDCPAP